MEPEREIPQPRLAGIPCDGTFLSLALWYGVLTLLAAMLAVGALNGLLSSGYRVDWGRDWKLVGIVFGVVLPNGFALSMAYLFVSRWLWSRRGSEQPFWTQRRYLVLGGIYVSWVILAFPVLAVLFIIAAVAGL